MSAIKINKILIINEIDSRIQKFIENKKLKREVESILVCYQFAKYFNISGLAKNLLNHIERCFTLLIESQNFVEFDYQVVSRISSCSGLLITSELEVYNACDKWLSYNIEERSNFARNILLKVRLHLLSDHALNHLLNERSSFTDIDACVTATTDVLKKKGDFVKNNFRYISEDFGQNSFRIFMCGGYHMTNKRALTEVKIIDAKNVENSNLVSSMNFQRFKHKAACINDDVFVFGGLDDNFSSIMSVDKYSFSEDKWITVSDMFVSNIDDDELEDFCLTNFMTKIFILGGHHYNSITNKCISFDTKSYKWKEIAEMNEPRKDAACTVFEGKVIICGGVSFHNNLLRSVESLDVFGNTWTQMPDMMFGKSSHNLVVLKNKMYAIGHASETHEVYDSHTQHFVAIKRPPNNLFNVRCISLDSQLLVVDDDRSLVFYYDDTKNAWTKK